MNNTDKAEEYHVRNGDHEKTIIMKLPKTYETVVGSGTIKFLLFGKINPGQKAPEM